MHEYSFDTQPQYVAFWAYNLTRVRYPCAWYRSLGPLSLGSTMTASRARDVRGLCVQRARRRTVPAAHGRHSAGGAAGRRRGASAGPLAHWPSWVADWVLIKSPRGLLVGGRGRRASHDAACACTYTYACRTCARGPHRSVSFSRVVWPAPSPQAQRSRGATNYKTHKTQECKTAC